MSNCTNEFITTKIFLTNLILIEILFDGTGKWESSLGQFLFSNSFLTRKSQKAEETEVT